MAENEGGLASEQRDELELLEAMRRDEEELSWEERDGVFSGVVRVEVDLLQPLVVSLANPPKEKTRKAASAKRASRQSATITHLPPIKLHFQLPPDYPARSPPLYSLACNWLNYTQLSKLCTALDRLWVEGEGCVVLYQWQQLLAHETLSQLCISSSLAVDVETPLPKMVNWDNRAVQEIEHSLMVLPTLVEYDAARKEKVFKTSVFTCEICFQSLLGEECVQIPSCRHVHCCECMRGHIAAKVSDGQVVQIDCLNSTCTELVPPSVIKDLVSPELFARYDRLLLQRSLDGMGDDIVYCPRPTCRCATLKEDKDDNMALCSRCLFCFCVLCKRTWHGVAPCKLLPDNLQELKDMYENGDTDFKKSLEQQYGKHQLEKAFADLESSAWIKTNSKQCPSCNSSIEKSHGCNKMTCSRCGHHFCWLCQSELDRQNPYRHFHFGASACGGKLFDGMDNEEEMEIVA